MLVGLVVLAWWYLFIIDYLFVCLVCVVEPKCYCLVVLVFPC